MPTVRWLWTSTVQAAHCPASDQQQVYSNSGFSDDESSAMNLLLYVLQWITTLLLFYSSTDRSVWASPDEKNLIAYLFDHKDYNPLIRPVKNRSKALIVKFEMALIQVITLDERKQLMKSNIWWRLNWEDYQLTWKPDDYGGIDYQLRIEAVRIWKPDIVLFNNADGKFEVDHKANILVDQTGSLWWIPCSIFKSSCTMDFRYFPFDEQRCNMSYRSWTYNGNEVKLDYYTPDFTKVDLTDYEKSGTWDVVDVPGEFRTWYDEKEGQTVSRAEYTIVLRRKTLFYTVNLILPCVLISILSMVVFYLPATAGEKITMSVSILLALVVYLQLLVTSLLPPSSLSLPLFARYLLFTVIIDVCCIISTIISLNLSKRTPRTHVLSPAMRTFFFKYVAGVLMMRRPADKSAPSQPQAATAPAAATASRNELDLSELHNINCRYAKMSAGQRRRVLEASSQSSYDGLRQEYNKAVEAVRFVAAHLKNEDDFGEVVDDWQFISLIFDRLLFYVYAIVTLAGTLAILMYAPHIFTDFNQAAFKEELRLERCCKSQAAGDLQKLEDCYVVPAHFKCDLKD